MTLNRLLITSVVVENRPVRDVAAQYGVSESWLFELLARYKTEGDAAVEPRSRRPHRVPTTTPAETVDLILELREKLTATGLDAAVPATASRPSCDVSTWSRRTGDPTTPRPKARWNGSSRR